jgi:hypothetical protein
LRIEEAENAWSDNGSKVTNYKSVVNQNLSHPVFIISPRLWILIDKPLTFEDVAQTGLQPKVTMASERLDRIRSFLLSDLCWDFIDVF